MDRNAKKEAMESPVLGMFGAMQSNGNLLSEREGAAEAKQMRELPVNGTKGREDEWKTLGFEFGEPEDDELFRPVLKQPDGWHLKSEGHDPRHMILLDNKGRRRGTMFYKNAFYDRKADIRLEPRLSVEYHPDFDNKTKLVVDAAHSIFEDKRTVFTVLFSFDEPMKDGEDQWAYADRARTACVKWLNERYPDWKSKVAYWDEEITGERVEFKR
jgi:hypothetical protein